LSLTLDNGIENRQHEEIGIPIYFCDPYSSWQKGGVENANKMIRRFIPKGSDISNYSDKEIAEIVRILNNKPRESLDYKTPYEVMIKHGLLTKKVQQKVALGG
jgi:IS30 family transposase